MKGLLFDVPVDGLQQHVDPMSGWLWGCERITIEEVWAAVEKGRLEARPWDSVKDALRGKPEARDFHINRVAQLVKNGYSTDDHAIVLDISPQQDGHPIGILNGNHRLAAAIVRQDDWIRVLAYVEEPTDLIALVPEAVLVAESRDAS